MPVGLPSKRIGVRCAALCVVIAGLAQATVALGDQFSRPFFDTEADTGAYSDLSIGSTNAQYDAGALAHRGPIDVSGKPVGFEFGGGYRPLPAWSGELDYLSLGRVSSAPSYVNSVGWLLSALLYLPTPFINLYGRLGLFDASTYGRCGCGPVGTPLYVVHQTGLSPMYGIGLITNRRGALNLRLEFDKFEISNATRATMTSIGLVWSFL